MKKGFGFICYLISVTGILYLLAFQQGIELETSTRIIIFLIMMCPFVFLPIGMYIYANMKDKQEEREQEIIDNLSSEEREKYYAQKRKEDMDNEIDYTIIVGGDTRKSVGSSVARGVIGGALLGPIGLIGGALSGKNKSETTFTVIYKSGRREVVTVSNDSDDFRRYASYVK